VSLTRRYFRCPACGLTSYPLDARLGLVDFLSPRATRLACLAVASWSFDVAADRLDELAGVRVDDETLRRHTLPAARTLLARRAAELPAVVPFTAADGCVEFTTDGVMAPTRDGWREVKIAVFQKRPDGAAAEPEEWATRVLRAPTAAVAFAHLEDCDTFADRWGAWAVRLGVTAAALTVLGDGAAWIWNRTTEQFPTAGVLLDIFHASEHIAAAARVLFGEGSGAGRVWTGRVRRRLLGDGWPGVCDEVGELLSGGALSAVGQTAVDELLSYFAGQSSRLGYYARLQAGRSIGSGAVEGLAKRVGTRLKVSGQGWDESHVDPMATLAITVQSREWDDLWKPSLS